MKKISSSNTTSMSDVRFRSGSSFARGRRFMVASRSKVRPRFHRLHELDGLFFHVDDERIDTTAQVLVAEQRWNRDCEPGRRRDQCLGNTAAERRRIADAFGLNRIERTDHADDGAEQTQERRDRRDRSQGADEALELVYDMPARVFDRLLDDAAITVAIGEARR